MKWLELPASWNWFREVVGRQTGSRDGLDGHPRSHLPLMSPHRQDETVVLAETDSRWKWRPSTEVPELCNLELSEP